MVSGLLAPISTSAPNLPPPVHIPYKGHVILHIGAGAAPDSNITPFTLPQVLS